MSEQPKGGNALPVISNEELDASFNALFSKEYDVDTTNGVNEVATAFVNLATAFIVNTKWKPLVPFIRFDPARLEATIRRFHRDAFGVKKFCEFVGLLQQSKKIDEASASEIIRQVKKLGIRITSDDPRRTKIVAAFALWLSALRPIYFEDVQKSGVSNAVVNNFCASFNLWVTEMFLKKFGTIEWGNNTNDCSIRLERFKHDFTFRAINMSSFEFFYGSIFRAYPEK